MKKKIKKMNIEICGLFETKVRKINFQHVSRCFGSNSKIESNRANEEGHGLDIIWLCWDLKLWELEEFVRHK